MRVYVGVNMPTTMEGQLELGKAILKQHDLESPNSPLSDHNMDEFTSMVRRCTVLDSEISALKKVLSNKEGERDALLGRMPEQTNRVRGHIQFHLAKIRDILLGYYKTKERKLSFYGYRVTFTVGKKSGPKRKKK